MNDTPGGMTAHELARKLMAGPDLPVRLADWGESYHYPALFTEVAVVRDRTFENTYGDDTKHEFVQLGSD